MDDATKVMSATPSPKVVLVTGASRGLGIALTTAFAEAQWQVIATARSSIPAQTGVQPVSLDVTHAEDIERVCAETIQRFGRIDALINNAGITRNVLLAELSEEDWDDVLAVNLRAAFQLSRAVARQMIRQRDGHIVNISSFSARNGPRGQTNYAAAKAGLVGLTQSLAKELGSRNVRVNVIFPGVMPTAMTAVLPEEQMVAFAKANALGRINSVDEVARFIVFLVGTQNISGQVFQLDSRVAPWT
jgi:3-oxoacyl-[acyl-carrier protein] reductase